MKVASEYGLTARFLHRIALGNLAAQLGCADIENRLFPDAGEGSMQGDPVFITSLPRAGTTLLLQILASHPTFATHTYRDMPFVMAPILWNRLTRGFRKSAIEHERAHGDGVMVSYDSPEAFEEILWLSFWPEKYGDRIIEPWLQEDRNADFETFFREHMAKICRVRKEIEPNAKPQRYLSKNNASIARLELLPTLFPECRIVIPLREPVSHCRSLLRQHRRFSAIHAESEFARFYMAAIGHFEFGADLRPIAFADIEGDPAELDFWLRYWIAAHESILRAALAYAAPQIVMVDYGELCSAPIASLEVLAGALGISADPLVHRAAALVRKPSRYEEQEKANEPLALEATALFETLQPFTVNFTDNSSQRGKLSVQR
jgi:hypothetical protein